MYPLPFMRDTRVQSWGLTVLRVIVGVIFAVHGWAKLQGGFAGTAGFFSSLGIPLPDIAAVVVTFVELLGGIALILGLGTRFVTIPLAIDMLTATLVFHRQFGLIEPNGMELPLSLLGAVIALMLLGPGAFALDNLIAARTATTNTTQTARTGI